VRRRASSEQRDHPGAKRGQRHAKGDAGSLEVDRSPVAIDPQCFIADDLLERLPAAAQVGKTKVGGIDLNRQRMRQVAEALIALSASATASRPPSSRLGFAHSANRPNRSTVPAESLTT
jgi:hypothetical protein